MEENTNIIEEELIESFSNLPLESKRKEIGWEITELQLLINKLIIDIAPDYKVKTQEEYDNLFDSETSEDDYLTGLYEDIVEMKESFSTYMESVTSAYYIDDNTEQ